MEDVRSSLSDFRRSDAYLLATVAGELQVCREARQKVLTAKSDPNARIQVTLGQTENTRLAELVLEPFGFGEVPTEEAYAKLVARVLDALDDYLTVAVLEKENELLRDFNIDPHR